VTHAGNFENRVLLAVSQLLASSALTMEYQAVIQKAMYDRMYDVTVTFFKNYFLQLVVIPFDSTVV